MTKEDFTRRVQNGGSNDGIFVVLAIIASPFVVMLTGWILQRVLPRTKQLSDRVLSILSTATVYRIEFEHVGWGD